MKSLGPLPVFSSEHNLSKDSRHRVGRASRHIDAVVVEDRGLWRRQKKIEGADAAGQVRQFDAIDGIEELGVEVVNPEFIEVAEDDVGRALRDDVAPVVEGLIVVFLQVRAARFHLDEDAVGPEEVREFLAAFRAGAGSAVPSDDELELWRAGFLGDAKLEGGAGFDRASVAEGAEEMIEEGLGFALLVAFEGTGEGNELGQRVV